MQRSEQTYLPGVNPSTDLPLQNATASPGHIQTLGGTSLSSVSPRVLQVFKASAPHSSLTTSSQVTPPALEQTSLARSQLQKQKFVLAGSSGGTIHHLTKSGHANPVSSSSQSTSLKASMSNSQLLPAGIGLKRSHTAPGAVLMATSPSCASSISYDTKFVTTKENSSVNQVKGMAQVTNSSEAPSPKRIKLENPAPSRNIENCRKFVCAYKRRKMREIKKRYREHLTELFYLQGGENFIDFPVWKSRPTQQLQSFLENSKLDSDEGEDEFQEKSDNDVKPVISAGSSIPQATPGGISTTLPPPASAQAQQGTGFSTSASSSLTTTFMPTTASELQLYLAKALDVRLGTVKPGSCSSQTVGTQCLSPGRSRQPSVSSLHENTAGGSQDVVERAKQEAQVVQRVNELRREGLWSAKRLPRVQEPPRHETHWDYLLKEMSWLAADFIQERKWKKAVAKKIARIIANHFKEREEKELKEKKEEVEKLKKIASHMARIVKEFWTNIEQIVLYKQTNSFERRTKSLDFHNCFVAGQNETRSPWLRVGENSISGYNASSDDHFLVFDNDEFEAADSHDEIIIGKQEATSDVAEDENEMDFVQKMSDVEDDVMKTLPKEMLNEPSNNLTFSDDSDSEVSLLSKGDFIGGIGEGDDDVNEGEEKIETFHSEELDNLKAEAEISIEELKKRYPGAYSQDPERQMMNENSDNGETSDSEEEHEPFLKEKDESEEDESQYSSDEKTDDSGLRPLLAEKVFALSDDLSTVKVSKEFQDVVSLAESLKPKGHTLDTTEVKTRVPFLLKHPLREYQLVGMDWLASIYDRGLNGILADEMGLGNTIQTIAFLAHLACERGVWGPHLIVVPANSLHSWEVELNNWCPAFKILTYTGSKGERRLKRQGLAKRNAFNVCLTSYKIVLEDYQVFRKRRWKYFILDAAQSIKNFTSERWQRLLNFSNHQQRLLLMRSPLSNSATELWSLMHFLFPSMHQFSTEFKAAFTESSWETNDTIVSDLRRMLMPFLLHRSRNEITDQLPQKSEQTIKCHLTERQRFLYDTILSQTNTKEVVATGNLLNLLSVLMQLRKVCNHPHLVHPQSVASPFVMDGIRYSTASAVTHVLERDPLDVVDIHSLYPNLGEMETDLPTFIAHKVKHSQVASKLIEEMDASELPHLSSQRQNNSAGALQSAGPGCTNVRPEVSSEWSADGVLQLAQTSSSAKATPSAFRGSSAFLSSSVPLQKASSVPSHQKPVMRVSPLVVPSSEDSRTCNSVQGQRSSSLIFGKCTPVKKKKRHQHVFQHNHTQSDSDHGCNIQHILDCMHSLDVTNSTTSHPSKTCANSDSWRGGGYVNCLVAQNRELNHNHPYVFWRESSSLCQLVQSPTDWQEQVKYGLSRCAFVIPSVISPGVSLHISHPDQPKLTAMLPSVQSQGVHTVPDIRQLHSSCGKLQVLDVMLHQLKSSQRRVMVFTQMTKMLDILEVFLSSRGYSYLRMDGAASVKQKQRVLDTFNADPRILCLILSTRSGGMVVNLTGVDTVIFYDSDWVPTLDDMASDCCNRINLTRDLHVYRLVSEGTIEENLANRGVQSKILNALAQQGGDAANAFLSKDVVQSLLGESSGHELVLKIKEEEVEGSLWQEEWNDAREMRGDKESKDEATVLSQFEQALFQVEDEVDAEAAELKAEFDADISSWEKDRELKDEEGQCRMETQLYLLDKLTPIERYAARVLESEVDLLSTGGHVFIENDIESSKRDWELARLKARRDEEENRAMLEMDGLLYTYCKDDSQMMVSDLDGAEMPIWCPPTPPQDDNDIYIDETMSFLYEQKVMSEQSLPPVYVPKAHKKIKMETVTTRKQKQRKEDQPRVPRSLFDKPKEVVMKQRRDAKMQRLRQNFQVPAKIIAGRLPVSQHQQQLSSPAPIIAKSEPDPSYPEWLVHEEWALLESVQRIQKLSPDLLVENPAQIVNWDFVSDFISVAGRIFRAAKHCRYQYECVVLPREDGRLIYNLKQKKNPKGIYKTKNTRPLRTEQLYSQEGLRNFSQLFDIRFAAMKEIGTKRPSVRQTIVNTAAKPAKHTAILNEHGINYDNPVMPTPLAARRAERIALDKKKQQQAAAQAQAVAANAASVDTAAISQRPAQTSIATPSVTPTIAGQQISSIVSVTPNTVITNQGPKLAVGPGLTTVSIARTLGAAAGNIIVNATAGLQAGPFAAINKRMSQAAGLPNTVAVSATLTPTIRGQRPQTPSTPTITMQDLGVTVATVGTSPAITVAAQAAAARSALQTTVASSIPTAGKKLAALTTVGPAATIQTQLVQAARSLTPHQINILRQNQSIIRTQSAPGIQQLRAQKLLTAEQLSAHHLKHPTQLLVPLKGQTVPQSILQGKQGLLRTKVTEEQLQALRMRTQIQSQSEKQLQAAQIIQGQVTPVGQSPVSATQTPIALVKSVPTAPAVTTLATNQATGLSVPQQRAALASRAATGNQIQQQHHMQLLQQRKAGIQQKVAGLAGGKASPIPLLIPQHSKLLSGNQILHQIGLVSLTSGSQTLTPGTPITVTHVSSASTPGVGLSLARQGAVKTATITSIDGGSTAIQVHPVQPGQRSVVGLPQSLVAAQSVQVQQTSAAQVSQFLQVAPLTVQAQSSVSQTQQSQLPAIAVPASLVGGTTRRATPTPPGVVPRPQTPTQISLITAPQPSVSTIATVQVQCSPSAETAPPIQIIAQNVPAPAAVATIVTQTSQPDSMQATAGQKASPYTMRTRNIKH